MHSFVAQLEEREVVWGRRWYTVVSTMDMGRTSGQPMGWLGWVGSRYGLNVNILLFCTENEIQQSLQLWAVLLVSLISMCDR